MVDLLPLVPLLPAAGALVNGVVGIPFFGRKATALVACGTLLAAFLIAVWLVAGLLALPPEAREHTVTLADWIPPIPLATSHGPASFRAAWALRLDPLSAVMVLVVSGIGFLIHVYSIGYMADESDGAYARFFCYLNLFVFFMLTLVLAANFLVLFVGWEGVGLCSYLLIGYWYERRSAADAGKKAFLVNRIGDFGFLLGVFFVFDTFGTLDFRAVADAAALRPVETAAFGTLSFACLLLFVGAVGKSAQIPLFVWLPDAMEGPTPVSALIHAATMVTAGIYMVSRNAVLFEHAPLVMQIVGVVGVLTALVAAAIGLVQNDIKRVLAYSTVSQLGYMFLATGVGAFAAGIFHLVTHAFFKALLFLGSGSVIHGMAGEQDMRRMGNLRKLLPITFATMMVGTLAIAGVPPLSGFFSKDEILYRAFLGHHVLWTLAVITAGLTAFYMFRLMALTFYGAYRGPAWEQDFVHGGPHGGHGHEQPHRHASAPGHPAGAWLGPHESPRVMTLPLVILAAGAIVAGFISIPAALGGGNALEHFLEPSFTARTVGTTGTASIPGIGGMASLESGPVADAPGASHGSASVELWLMVLSVAVVLIGIAVAWRMYVQRPGAADALAARLPGIHRILLNKLYVDELYDATVVRGIMRATRVSWFFDRWIVDGLVNASGWMTRVTAWLSGLVDKHAVDGMVNGAGNTLWEASLGYRRLQTGLIQNYALLMIVGIVTLVSTFLFLR